MILRLKLAISSPVSVTRLRTPTPVVRPYTLSPRSTTRSTSARVRAIRSIADGATSTRAPARATATTSPTSSEEPSTMTVAMSGDCMGAYESLAAVLLLEREGENPGGPSVQMPEQIPPSARDESFAGVSYHIRGELVPQLQIEVGEQQVMFEHHVLLWKTTPLEVELRKLSGGTSARSPGSTSSSPRRRGGARSRSRATLRASAFRSTSRRARSCTSASTSSSLRPTISTTRSSASRASATCCSAAPGLFMDKFRRRTAMRWCGCTATATCSWPSSTPASSSMSRPAPGSGRIQASSSSRSRPASRWAVFGGGGKLTWNRFTGPGRLALQTMFIAPLEGVESGSNVAQAAGAVGVGRPARQDARVAPSEAPRGGTR